MAREGLSFEWEWESAESIGTPELRATFVRLHVTVGGEDVTLVEDRSSRSSRRSVYVSLYPLAEWIAFNWWNLLHDSRPSRDYRPEAAPRHSLRASGDGFMWPNMTIVPEGRNTRVTWRSDDTHSRAVPTRYLTSGEAFVDSMEVERELSDLVEATVGRLREMGVEGTRLESEWEAIRNLDREEADFCAAVARLGLDPFGGGAEHEDDVLRVAGVLGRTPILDDFLDAVTVGRLDDSLAWTVEGLELVRRETSAPELSEISRQQIVEESRVPALEHPWRTGWRQAVAARRRLELAAVEPFRVEPFLREVSLPVRDRALVAVGQAGHDASPVVVVGRGRRPSSRRFTMARALWRHVGGAPDGPFLISSAYSGVQRVERAFAAELLAPAEGIADLLDVDPHEAQQDDFDVIAEHFDVSPIVVQHQLENQLLG